MQQYLRLRQPDSFYTTASGGLGYSLPAAVGVAMGSPGRRVVAILGDGSAMYSIQGLFAAARQRVPVTFIILNNSSYAALKSFGRLFGMDRVEGTDLAGLDFCALAQGQGVPSVRVDNARDLDRELARAFKSDGPSLIEVRIVGSSGAH
jgi:benzoylformate decarboxylase